jgi:hypothetical protein
MCDHAYDIQNYCMLCGLFTLQDDKNIYERYKTSSHTRRVLYFSKIVECYTGTQAFKDETVITRVSTYIHRYYPNVSATQRHIHMSLKHLHLSKYYDSIYYIYCSINGYIPRTLDRFTIATLFRMYDDFLSVFVLKYPNQNFINIRYVLQRFLTHFNVQEPPLFFYKSIDTYKKQEMMFNNCFLELDKNLYFTV